MPIDYQNDLGVTLLHVAAQNGNKRIAKLCLRKGADVNKRNNNGQVGHERKARLYCCLGDPVVGDFFPPFVAVSSLLALSLFVTSYCAPKTKKTIPKTKKTNTIC